MYSSAFSLSFWMLLSSLQQNPIDIEEDDWMGFPATMTILLLPCIDAEFIFFFLFATTLEP